MKRITTLTVIILIISLFSQNVPALEMALQENLVENGRFLSESANIEFDDDKTSRTENQNGFVVSEKSEVDNSIYLLGDATTVGWDNNNALEMEHIGDGVFEIVADIIEGPYIKFISVLGQWTPQWGTDASGTSESGILVYQATDSDPNVEIAIPAPVPGQYLIQADTVNLTYTITPFQNSVYLLGDATTVGWDNTMGLPMTYMGDGVFEIETEIIQGNHIKFISVLGQWAPQWGTDETGTSMSGPLVYRPTLDVTDPDNIPAPMPGQYLIQADTVNLTYTITPSQNSVYLLGDATTAGWDNTMGLPMTYTGDGIFEITTEIIQGNHIKFISVLGQWAPQWGTDETGTSTSGPLVYRPTLDVPDPANIPAPLPGQYIIQADTVNLIYNIFPLFDTLTLTFNVSNEDGMAIYDATIMLHGNTIYEPGEYVIEGLMEGNVTYTVWRSGYANQSGTIHIDQDTDLDILLTSLPSGTASVYLLGNATSAGWDNQVALPMQHLGDGVFEIITDIIDADGYIKFISQPGQWAPQWGTNENGTLTGGPLIYRPVDLISDPMAIPAPAEGQYRIRADVINLEYSIELVTLPKITFIVLDVNNDPIPDARISMQGQAYPVGQYVFEEVEAGSYHYIVWKDGMTAAQGIATINDADVIITEVLNYIPEEDYRFYLLGDATTAGWDNTAAIEIPSQGNGIFQLDVEIVEGLYLKFISVLGQWAPQWGTNANGAFTSGELVYQPNPFTSSPEAIPAPPPGFYRVLADTINNTYTISEISTEVTQADQPSKKLFPNPARDEVRVQSTADITFIAIRDITGKIVYEMEVRSNHAKIPLYGLAPGVFIVQIFSRDSVSIEKLIIDR